MRKRSNYYNLAQAYVWIAIMAYLNLFSFINFFSLLVSSVVGEYSGCWVVKHIGYRNAMIMHQQIVAVFQLKKMCITSKEMIIMAVLIWKVNHKKEKNTEKRKSWCLGKAIPSLLASTKTVIDIRFTINYYQGCVNRSLAKSLCKHANFRRSWDISM